mgnify:CR=1 FL=1
MKKYIAQVYMTKHATEDNYHEGCASSRSFVYDEHFTVEFTDTKNLIEKLCVWTENFFSIDSEAFMKYISNEIENNRFMYSQSEDGDSNLTNITVDNPNGYLCDYDYYIETVSEIVEYEFVGILN